MNSSRPLSLRDILLLPFGCMLQIPLPIAAVSAIVIVGIGAILYYTTNSDFGGLARSAFENLEVSGDFGQVRSTADGRSWTITYEYFNDTTFAGTVRHVFHWREDDIPFATHDILVTTDDFANPDLIKTDVSNHRFQYTYPADFQPTGHINLLHIVPLNEDIYQQLLTVRDWNTVTLTGREILKIDMFNAEGLSLGYFQDAGCNTILVKSVEIND
jgi:hypothetical protein